ncbi:MAG: VWA domain-containing protein [Planctomycetes bacterium]|nr:VWA domain-containing protein [Planctomycetota bacterium]
MRFGNYQALWLLWSLPFLAMVFGYSFYRKQLALKQFATHDLLKQINTYASVKRQLLKAALLLIAVMAIVTALTQPGWNPRPEKIQRKGRNIVVLMDVSNSMLAEDLYPNRLEHAKLAVRDLLDVLDGDRIGIIAFAGTCAVKCPLTQDYGFVRMALADIGPQSIQRGGTNIGDAIRIAYQDVFNPDERNFKDIILITDGEDHDSFPEQAAEKAAEEGVRIYAIGLGDDKEGSRIPITGPDGEKIFIKYEGEEVWSKLDSLTLGKIALATGGKFWNVGVGTFDLAELYHASIATADQKELDSTTIMRYDEKFQLFLALALSLLMIEAFISERKKN